jgi:Plasmid pRiA4b ORF-3-like protein
VEEGEPGVPEEEVRLDEVLADPGDTLCYLYDFGHNWEHVIRLEAVAPWDDTAPAAVCLDGRRDGLPEDCGGLGGYELISAAIDPLNPDHSDAVIEFERMYGIGFHAGSNGLTPFRIDVINAELAKRFPPGARPERADPPGDLPGPLEELLSAVRDGHARRELRWLMGAALAGKPDIDTVTAARMVRPYAWLLDRVGDEGIRLTGAGYLPPAHVEAAATEPGLLEDWMGKGKRETQTLPVLHLRENRHQDGPAAQAPRDAAAHGRWPEAEDRSGVAVVASGRTHAAQIRRSLPDTGRAHLAARGGSPASQRSGGAASGELIMKFGTVRKKFKQRG